MGLIVAFDPGGTTGWAAYLEADTHLVTPTPRFDCGQLGPEPHHKELFNKLTLNVPKTVITESFEFRQSDVNRTKINLISREYIGVMRLWSDIHPWAGFYQQTPSQAKALISNEWIKALDLWKPGQRHAMDAMRHLLWYLVNKQGHKELVPRL